MTVKFTSAGTVSHSLSYTGSHTIHHVTWWGLDNYQNIQRGPTSSTDVIKKAHVQTFWEQHFPAHISPPPRDFPNSWMWSWFSCSRRKNNSGFSILEENLLCNGRICWELKRHYCTASESVHATRPLNWSICMGKWKTVHQLIWTRCLQWIKTGKHAESLKRGSLLASKVSPMIGCKRMCEGWFTFLT